MKIPLPRQFALDISQTPKATLDNFLPGKDLALLSHLRKLVDAWESQKSSRSTENPLNQRWVYWWGQEGSGRSHLLSALDKTAEQLGMEHFSLSPNEPISWVRLEEKMDSLVKLETPSAITVDDVDRLDASKAIHIFMAGKAAPANLEMREDLRTRLAWGLVFQTHLLDDDEKIQALEQAAQARGLVLSPDVLPWLFNRFYRDMPNLMALMDALDSYSLETKRAVTLPLVRELLQPKQNIS